MGAGGSVATQVERCSTELGSEKMKPEVCETIMEKEKELVKSAILDYKGTQRGNKTKSEQEETEGEKQSAGGAEENDTESFPNVEKALKEVCGIESDELRQEMLEFYKKSGNNNYIPLPQDTSGVEIPDHLTFLTEKLAENAHECWSAQRISQGWTYGPQRDDNLKHHPCLIPYCDLTDDEREYDRVTAMNTLKLLLSFGYKMTPPESSSDAPKQDVEGTKEGGEEVEQEK